MEPPTPKNSEDGEFVSIDGRGTQEGGPSDDSFPRGEDLPGTDRTRRPAPRPRADPGTAPPTQFLGHGPRDGAADLLRLGPGQRAARHPAERALLGTDPGAILPGEPPGAPAGDGLA